MLWLVAGTVGTPVLFLLGINLWLASSPGRKWIGGKISAKTGLETVVGRTSVTPWAGVTIHQLVVSQPEALRDGVSAPLAEVAEIRLATVWKAWLRGRLEVRTVELDSPHITLPVDLIAHLGAQHPQVPQAPAIAQATPNAIAPGPGEPHQPTGPPPAAALPPGVQPPVVQAPSPQQPAAPVATPAAELAPTGWIRLHDASFSLVKAGRPGPPIIRISGVNGEIPASGATADSIIRIAEIACGGCEPIKPPEIPVHWQTPELAFTESKWNLGGWNLALAAKCAFRPGLPFVVEVVLPKQDGDWQATHFLRGTKISTANSFGRVTGFAMVPATWQGDFALGTEKLSLSLHDHLTFDQTGLLLAFRPNVVACREVLAIGESASFLGNGLILADGRCAAVLRVVLPPDASSNLIGKTNAVLPGTIWGFAPLGAPDRVYADISVHGTFDQISVTLGDGGSTLPLSQAVTLFQHLSPHP